MEERVTKSRTNCSVVGCNNTYRNCTPGTRFFVFPNNKEHIIRRKAWIAALKRDTTHGKPWNPTSNSRVCSRHFVDGTPTRDPDSPGYIPRLYMKPNLWDQHQQREERRVTTRYKRRKRREETAMVDNMDIVKEEIISEEEYVPMTSVLEDNVMEMKEEDQSESVLSTSVETGIELSLGKVKVEPDLDEDWETLSPKLDFCNVKVEEEPESFTFIALEESGSPPIVKDEFKCEVTSEEDDVESHINMDRIKMEPHSEVGAIPITFPAETKPMHIKAEEAHLQITFPSIEPEVTEHNAIKMECDETTEVIEGDEVGKRKKEVKPVSITFPLIKKEIEHESFHSTVLEEQSTQAIVKEEHDINIQCGTELIVLDDSPIEENDEHTESDKQRNNVYSFDTSPKKSRPNCGNRKIFDELDTDCKPLPCSKSFTTPEQLPNQVCANIQKKNNVVNKNKKLLHKRKNKKTQDHSKRKERKFFCEICDKQFSFYNSLFRHRQAIHLKLKRFRCPECDLHFTRNDQLTHHRQIHRQQRPRPFQCEECNKTYFSNKSLIRHRLIHKGRGLNNTIKEQKNAHFRCKICFKQFYDTRGLQSHLRTHTGDKPFKCDICSKQFAVKATLITHIYTHAAEKPFKCLHCNKQFVRKHRYTDHLNVHSQEKQYQCEICFKEYYLKRNFLIHKHTHNKKKSVK